MNIKEKNFDPTVSFMFFGTWVKAIDDVKQACGAEEAYRFYKVIADYCMYEEEPDFSYNLMLNALWKVIIQQADASIAHRKTQFEKDTLNENHQKILAALKEHPNLSNRQIAKTLGISASMVDRVHRKHKEELTVCAEDTPDVAVSAPDSLPFGNSYSDFHTAPADVNDTLTQRNDAEDDQEDEDWPYAEERDEQSLDYEEDDPDNMPF